MISQVRISDAASLGDSFAPLGHSVVFRWWLGWAGLAGLVSKMVLLSSLALHVVSGPHHRGPSHSVAALLTWELRNPAVRAPRQEEALSL